ncbi:MAG: hypothetical protein Unbinned8699contig1000_58, partial [Prokaryotic dsDNA virus sp.]
SLRPLSGATRQKDPRPSGRDLELRGTTIGNTTDGSDSVHHERIGVAAYVSF